MPDGSESWISFMRRGAFENAWTLRDEAVRQGVNRDFLNLPRHFQNIWDGTPLSGRRVLIRCYHGLGDTIMFIRYAAAVKEIAAEVIVWAQPKLLGLLKTAEGIDALIPLHDGVPETTYDTDVEIMELPHIFRTEISTIPRKMPYLYVRSWRLQCQSYMLTAGLVWKAGDWDPSRNIPFKLIMKFFQLKGIRYIILQDNAEAAGWTDQYGVHPGNCTLYDHARIIAGLDIMITVDSMPAHLSGALNIPTCLLLPALPDWRWMESREDSPWYPSMRLFRQPEQGDWESVIDKVLSELIKLTERSNLF